MCPYTEYVKPDFGPEMRTFVTRSMKWINLLKPANNKQRDFKIIGIDINKMLLEICNMFCVSAFAVQYFNVYYMNFIPFELMNYSFESFNAWITIFSVSKKKLFVRHNDFHWNVYALLRIICEVFY